MDVEDNKTSNHKQQVFMNEGINLSEEEIKKKREELKKYKISANGNMKDKLLLARGNRLYQELTGINRERVAAAMQQFEYVLSVNDKQAVHTLREQINEFFDRCEEFLDG